MSAEIFGEELPGERELIVEATMRNLANMIANNRWLDTPEKVEAYCNQSGMDLANYALGMRKDLQTLNQRPARLRAERRRFALGTGAGSFDAMPKRRADADHRRFFEEFAAVGRLHRHGRLVQALKRPFRVRGHKRTGPAPPASKTVGALRRDPQRLSELGVSQRAGHGPGPVPWAVQGPCPPDRLPNACHAPALTRISASAPRPRPAARSRYSSRLGRAAPSAGRARHAAA